MNWFGRAAWKYVKFFGIVVGAALAGSWLLGTDDAVKAWAKENRPITLAIVALSMVIYALYSFLEEIDR